MKRFEIIVNGMIIYLLCVCPVIVAKEFNSILFHDDTFISTLGWIILLLFAGMFSYNLNSLVESLKSQDTKENRE